MIWTIIEPGLGITAASIVTLRPLLRALKIWGFASDSGGPYARGHDSAPPGNGPHDLEAIGRSQELGMIRTSSAAMTTTTVCSGKRGASVSMQTYSGSNNESQEVILASLESREGLRDEN